MKGLLNCPNLEVLDVSDNFIKEEAGEELSKVVVKCNNLISLNLSDCNMDKSENDVIVKSLEEVKIYINFEDYYLIVFANKKKKKTYPFINFEVYFKNTFFFYLERRA